MRKFLFIFSIAFSAMTAKLSATSIEVKNTSTLDHSKEIVEINADEIDFNLNKSFILLDSDKNEIVYQLLRDNKGNVSSLIFQSTVEAGKSEKYKLKKGKAAQAKPLTSARFVSERKDDFAWENDFGAYRMYGPALAKENPSNGVDFWLKKTTELIVDTFYYNELNLHKSYHTDWGKGLDLYKVGHTLGAGGFAPFYNDSLFIGNHFDSYEVLANGPIRSQFKLTYNQFKVGDDYFKAEITITTDAGSIMNKAEVKLIGNEKALAMASGIVLHDGKGKLEFGSNWTAYGEVGISEFGVPSGDFYTAILVPSDFIQFKQKNNHSLQICEYKVNETFTYYFGGGWSKWRHATFADWVKDVELFSAKLKTPLVIQ